MEFIRSKIDYVGNKIESNLPMDTILALSGPLVRKRDISEAIQANENDENSLAKVLNAFDLTAIGVGCIIGAGIFVV